jgi:hypothetical protein
LEKADINPEMMSPMKNGKKAHKKRGRGRLSQPK